jgi:formate hydrogenlyase transcriptional activator
MDLHPGLEQRQKREVKRAELDPILRGLQENEDWYQDLVEHSQDLLCIHDLSGKLLSVNPAPARALGYSVEELLQIPMRALVAPESRPQFDSYLAEIQRRGHASGLVPLITKSGERRIWRYYNTLRTEGVETPIVRGIAHDITEQVRTEEEFREVGETLLSEGREKDSTIRTLKLFRALVDQSNDAIEVIDPVSLRFLDVNEKACSALGYSREELLSLTVFDIDSEFTQTSQVKIRAELQKSGCLVMESMHRRKDGSVFPVEVSLRWVHIEQDYVVAVARDLSERKRAEAVLREREKTQELILDHLSVGVILSRVGGEQVFYQNPKFAELFGYSTTECPAVKEWWPLAYPDPAYREWVSQEWYRRMAKAVESQGEIEPMEVTVTCKDGSKKYVRVLAKVIGDLNFVSFVDLTKRRQAEEQVRTSEDRNRALYEHAPVGICRVESGTGKFLGVNAKYCEILGRTEQELSSLDFQSITHPDDLAMNLEKWRQLRDGEVRHYEIEKRYLRPDGTVRWVEVKVVAMWPEDAEPAWHMAIVEDVTESKRANERLREYERVVEGLEEMIAVVDRDYRYVIANRAFLERRNMTKEQVLGRRVDEVVQQEIFEEIIKPRVDECFGGKVVQYEMKYKYPQLGERDLFISYFPIQGTDGVDRIASVLRDVTDRKRAQQALRDREENYRMFISQSSEGIFREDMDAPVAVNLSEDELVRHILHDSYMAECNDAMAKMYGFARGEELLGKRLTEMLPPEDPHNIELTREYIRSGFRVLDRESHEVDMHGNPKVFLNSMIGIVENGKLVRTWGIQRDVTERTKLEESRQQAEAALRQSVADLHVVTEELREAKEKLSEEKIYLEQAIGTELGFGEIIGRSPALKDVMEQVVKVASSDATVLIMGETGTGKELVARAIHRESRRKDNSFIKLNCAAIPSGLLESELFGHEKGAFTGAITKKLGRLELANQGTLFLDEIGEIPLELQPKLLRVLQDHEFERLGGTRTLHVNFRLLAATNRDLRQAVNQREFRSDLYYRLNVFPIRTPPLRERREDIPPLVEHFVGKYAARMGKPIASIPAKTMEALVQWPWPGNIRELENFVERSVILTSGKVLQVPLSELSAVVAQRNSETLAERERECILRALRECKGRLGGPNGAAARLGLKRTTLQSKLRHLGIDLRAFRS